MEILKAAVAAAAATAAAEAEAAAAVAADQYQIDLTRCKMQDRICKLHISVRCAESGGDINIDIRDCPVTAERQGPHTAFKINLKTRFGKMLSRSF